MLRKLTYSLLLCCLYLSSFSQNGLDIIAFTSPTSNIDYNTSSTVDINVIIQNDGPNFIVNTDTFYIDLSIANADTTEFYNFKVPSASFFNVDDRKEYTLITNYQFKAKRSYRLCATILGSRSFPTNTTKNANRCVTVFDYLDQNSMDIQAFTSPLPNVNYDTSATVNISATILNEGPSVIEDTDTLYINLSVENSDTTELYSLAVPAEDSLEVGGVKEYTFLQNYTFSSEHNYKICATLTGSKFFQTNSTTNLSECVSVVVGLEQLMKEFKPTKLRYLNNEILFSSKAGFSAEVQVYNLSGKLMIQENIRLDSENSVHFNAPANGLYFLRIILPNGKSSTAKFVVH